jgi:predicted transposase/invertase (TIGR01784 family)
LPPKPDAALVRAQELIPQVRESAEPSEKQQHLIEFIEAVISYQFPKMGRKESENMLQVESYRETRLFQEGVEEGLEKGREEAQIAIARRMLANKHSLEEITKCTGLTLSEVKKLKKQPGTDK